MCYSSSIILFQCHTCDPSEKSKDVHVFYKEKNVISPTLFEFHPHLIEEKSYNIHVC